VLTLGLWAALALLAYTVKGFGGFGDALVVMPVLAVLYSPRVALGTSALLDLVVGVGFLAVLGFPTGLQLARLRAMAGYMVVGTVVGSLGAALVPRRVLLFLVALVVVVLAVRLLRPSPASSGLPSRVALQVSALLAGVSGGLVGVSGPFLVAGVARLGKAEMRQLLVAIFLVEALVKTVVYAATATIDGQALRLATLAAPAVVVGLVVGAWLHAHASQAQFTRALGFLLLALAAAPLAAALA